MQGEAIDIRAAESDKSEAAHDVLLRTILPLIEEAHGVIRSVAIRFDESDEHDSAAMAIADIATLAGMTLQERRGFLTHTEPCDHWTFLENCEHSLRSLGKSACVVEGALARYAGVPPLAGRATNIASSLAVRRRYATLRHEIRRISHQEIGVLRRLQAVSRSISSLLNCNEYRSMRLGDRRQLRMLQFRIQSWLSAERPSATEGERTWQEVIAVASLLAGVNQRSELVAHDADALHHLAETVTATDDVRILREAAAPLFGLDAELDVLLDIRAAEGNDHRLWRETVERLGAQRGIVPDDGADCSAGTLMNGNDDLRRANGARCSQTTR